VGKATGARECAPDGVPTSPCRNRALDGGHGAKSAFVVLSQKVARFEFENQLFEKIQDWRARC
jgi:hypothetical protein